VVSAGQARRAGSNDGHLFLFFLLGGREALAGLKGMIPEETLQGVNGGGFIEFLAVA
jgi:hypothetical protein